MIPPMLFLVRLATLAVALPRGFYSHRGLRSGFKSVDILFVHRKSRRHNVGISVLGFRAVNFVPQTLECFSRRASAVFDGITSVDKVVRAWSTIVGL